MNYEVNYHDISIFRSIQYNIINSIFINIMFSIKRHNKRLHGRVSEERSSKPNLYEFDSADLPAYLSSKEQEKALRSPAPPSPPPYSSREHTSANVRERNSPVGNYRK